MASAVIVNDLKKYYGPVKAVDGISFEVKEGSIFGILGPNGAGKTTSIETIVGLNKKDSGYISIMGYDNEKELDKIKKIIGVQLQSPTLFPRLTVKETLDLFASFYSTPRKSGEVLELLELTEKSSTRVHKLSGGQRHRLAVGLAIVSNGDILFLDEPTTGLDPQSRRKLWEVIVNLKKEGKTILLSTHYMDEAEELCDELIIIDRGKIIARGSPRTLVKEHFSETAIEITDIDLSEEEIENLQSLNPERKVFYEQAESRLILYSDDLLFTMKELIEFTTGIGKAVSDIVVRNPDLEDVFLKLTGRRIRERKCLKPYLSLP